MEFTVYKKSFSPPEINTKEILRYAGCKKPSQDVELLLNEALRQTEGKLTYSVCFCKVPINIKENLVDLSFAKIESTHLAKCLNGCDSAVIFAATIGLNIDRLIAKSSKTSPSLSVMLQSLGAERIESLCNKFEEYISSESSEKIYLKPRFSPGYGDLPIDFQRQIFSLLNCNKHIGLSLNDSLIMSPSKSVTAIIGISDKICVPKTECSYCIKTDCEFRQGENNDC